MCNSHLLKPSLPWQNLVGLYIILYYVRTDDLADDFFLRIVETDVVSYLVGLLQNLNLKYSRKLFAKIMIISVKLGICYAHFQLSKS